MKVELLYITENPEEHIEKVGRTCYKSDDKIRNLSYVDFITRIIKNGHESVLEHATATFKITGISRTCSHQLVRHRAGFSYAQESQRYVEESSFEMIEPESIKNNENAHKIYVSYMHKVKKIYSELRDLGVKKEDARFVIPQAIETTVVVTANFRAWRNFLKLRLNKSAQWEIREMAQEILSILGKHATSCFSDL